MSKKFDDIMATSIKSHEQGMELMEKLTAVAKPGSVYSEPVTAGEYTVITASEVMVGLGFGYGMGGGEGDSPGPDGGQEGAGFGGGGGGGGSASGRPVAVISIGPDGVDIEPIVDVTKTAIAFLTTIGSMFFLLRKMRKM